jgi:hypothetical protein
MHPGFNPKYPAHPPPKKKKREKNSVFCVCYANPVKLEKENDIILLDDRL